MSIVVEQTLPYTNTQLQLEDPKRWSKLLPLMRPSIKTLETANGKTVAIETALASTKNTLIAAIGSVGNFSSKILSKFHLAAFFTETYGRPSISAEEISKALKESGLPTENGVVVVRVASNQYMRVFPGGVEVAVVGEVKLDHVLSLLAASNLETKASFDKTYALLDHFIQSAASTTSKFSETKTGNGPNIIHAIEIAEFNSAKTAIVRDLGHLMGSNPSLETNVVYSIHFSDINGLSRLENNILAHEISEYFAKRKLPSYISQSTILDHDAQARGWAISLCAIPSTFINARSPPSNHLANNAAATLSTRPREGSSKIQVSDAQVRKVIIAGCESVIKDEPTITEYDTIVGDGDCGYTLRDGAKQVLHFISSADLSALPSTLTSLVDDLEVNMGGTSGALYCIFLSSLAQELWSAPTLPDALKAALDHLMKYTKARLGDRTCLDCLIPFVETLQKTGDVGKALADAEKGVESTKKLEAKLGRSSYLDDATTRGVPDPGAYGLLKLLEGMVDAK